MEEKGHRGWWIFWKRNGCTRPATLCTLKALGSFVRGRIRLEEDLYLVPFRTRLRVTNLELRERVATRTNVENLYERIYTRKSLKGPSRSIDYISRRRNPSRSIRGSNGGSKSQHSYLIVSEFVRKSGVASTITVMFIREMFPSMTRPRSFDSLSNLLLFFFFCTNRFSYFSMQDRTSRSAHIHVYALLSRSIVDVHANPLKNRASRIVPATYHFYVRSLSYENYDQTCLRR